jgi:hypothetical protein
MDSVLVVLLPFLMLIPFYMFLFKFVHRQRNCPDCGQSLNRSQPFRTVTWRQWFEGGFLCQNCGCETTLANEKVAPGTGPRTRSVIRGILLVTVIVGAVPVLLFFILSQSTVTPALVATPAVVAPSPDIAAPPVAPLPAK